MYKVEMKYIDMNDMETPMSFTCDGYNVGKSTHRFENVKLNDFMIKDFEISNEDISYIQIN